MKKDITLYQDNAITKASYNMSALEKDILFLLISQMNKDDKQGKAYFIEGKELMTRKGEEISFSDFKKASSLLLSRFFETMIDEHRLLQSSFISSAIYHKGKGLIEIRVDPNVLPLYCDLKKNFTTIQLDMALRLSSKYAKRVYEYVSMLKNFPNPHAIIDLMELKKRLGVAIVKDGELVKDNYPLFADFNRRVLRVAKAEIDTTDVNFTYEPIYDKNSAKKVSAIKFTVTKVQTVETMKTDEQYHTILSRLVNEFRLRQDQAQQVLATTNRQEILKTLYDISLERPKIRSIGAYTAKLFNLV